MTKGTIYWDESSRGSHHNAGRTPYKRGRWVGERTENGRRVRMRSTDYDKVLRWVQSYDPKADRIALKGMPQYSVNIERQEVYNRYGRTLKGSCDHDRRVYHLVHNGTNHTLSWERIAYAVLHNIEVLKIPSGIIVVQSQGEYFLQHAGDFHVSMNKRTRHRKLMKIDNILSRRMQELQMLQRYYKTGDQIEIVTYATKDCFNHLVLYLVKRYRCRMQRATDIVTEATEQFLHRVTIGDLPAISISATIQGLCAKIMSQRSKQREYNDNLIHE